MENFCGSTFWDWNVTWNTNDPDLTPCFEETVLLWIPCCLLWITALLELNNYAKIEYPIQLRRSYYSNLKAVTCLSAIVLQVAIVLCQFYLRDSKEEALPPAVLYTPIIKISSLVLAFSLQISHRYKGIRTSGFQFLFWLFLSVCEAVVLRSMVKRQENHGAIFILFTIYSSLVFIQFFFHCWADASPLADHGTQPLIEENENSGIPCPELKASFLSKLFFHWAGSLLWNGFRNPIKFEDLWELRPCDKSNRLVPEFLRHSKSKLKYDQPVTKRGIWKTILLPLWKTFGSHYLCAIVIKQCCDLLLFASPLILSLLIYHVENYKEEFAWKGYFYVLLLLGASIVQNLMTNHYNYLIWTLGTNIRSTLNCSVYRKSLKLTNAERKESTTGEIVNLMSVDVDKVMHLITWFDQVWGAPIQISIALYFLYAQLGLAIFAGLGVLLIIIPFNLWVMSKMEVYQTAQMEKKDERVKMMNEILSGIKILKFYAWEPSFQEKVSNIRENEVGILKKQAYINSFVELCWNSCPLLIALASFATYILMDSTHVFTAEKAFVSISLFNLLSVPTTLLPMILVRSVESKVSLKRLCDFMNSEERDENAIKHDGCEENPITVRNATFSWEEDKETLKNINLEIKTGSLVAIVGVVGCGKSSLLSALLGDIRKLRGQVNVVGSTAYVAQQAWIQNATVKDNILFGCPLESRRYDKILDACSLRADLEILPGGVMTEIGEKGINLSGGQKQRVALARAAYHNSDIYLLDDPLSAVDSHVGKHIFDNLLGSTSGLLRNKTRVLVTHGVTYLPQMDNIIVIKDGEISESGTYNELLEKRGAFADFLDQYMGETAEDDQKTGENSEITRNLTNVPGTSKVQLGKQRSRTMSSEIDSLLNEERKSDLVLNGKENLIGKETTETGNVKFSVYKAYFRSVGLLPLFSIILFYFGQQGFGVGSNMWLSLWSEEPVVNGTQSSSKRDMYLGIYATLGITQCLTGLFAAVILQVSVLNASNKMHKGMLTRIFRAPMSFFDTTPTGRIINRFSEDVQTLDQNIPWFISQYISSAVKVLATMVVISITTPIFLVVLVFLSIIYILIQRYYITTSRQLFRIESTIRSPIFSHFTETLNGTSTILAFSAQDRFILENEKRVENQQKTTFPWIVIEKWISVRLEALGNIVVFFAALFCVMERDTISPSSVGLSIMYALQITQCLNQLTMISSYLETYIVAAERITEYSNVVQEADWEKPEKKPNVSWPENGRITFENFSTRYREGLDLVLKDVNCQIEPGERIGIVGRTGAGKSSITLGLFRIIEASEGSIYIDQENISDLGLHDIRQRLTIIPQDPVLFSGSLRFNLDPFMHYADSELWVALEYSHLKDFVKGLSEGLQHEISEGGENLSVGQRQLVCLARAILRKTKILVLDEATAAVDLETDDLIQQTIRKEFQDCTILTIAHRLNTIMDSSRVMVLDNGIIAEFDSPSNLLANQNSLFFNMAKDAGLSTSAL